MISTLRNAALAVAVLSIPAFAAPPSSNRDNSSPQNSPSMNRADRGTGGGGATDAMQTGTANTGSMQSMIKTEIPFDERGFVERIHQINQDEVTLGNLAKQKATDSQVKDFADMMVRDHEQADKDLQTMAKSKNMKLDKPKAANDTEKKMMEAQDKQVAFLKSANGPAFDSAYMALMVQGHDHAIMLASLAEQKWNAGDVHDLAAKLVPQLKTHREHAATTLSSLDITKDMGGMATGGSGMEQGMSGKAKSKKDSGM